MNSDELGNYSNAACATPCYVNRIRHGVVDIFNYLIMVVFSTSTRAWYRRGRRKIDNILILKTVKLYSPTRQNSIGVIRGATCLVVRRKIGGWLVCFCITMKLITLIICRNTKVGLYFFRYNAMSQIITCSRRR